ncbi:partner and localizer of BRCA2 [Conger conger]|uniref:partner and localizer of BRCA2 n=1 Tax=Conger conger TaxID=82655 RepID=UPI002A5A5E37|nr:partner and localizer of BRCA2 [Conger conger]
MLHFRTMEESLKTVLHCDDKEKLKERLAILQREYNRTVQRLKRAERSDAVRNYVRSRLAEQNLRQEGQDPDSLSEPSEAKGRRPCPVNHSGPEDQKQSPSVLFSLPHDVLRPDVSPGVAAGSSESSRLSDTPQEESPAPGQGPRRRSAHRLRSRRSRLRWERRERTDSGVSDTENTETSEDGRDPAIDFGAGTSQSQPKPEPDGIVATVGGEYTELTHDQGPVNLPVSAHRTEHGGGSTDTAVSDIKTAPVLGPPDCPTAATPVPSSDGAGTLSALVSEVSVSEPEAPTEECPQSGMALPAPGGAGCLDSCTLIEGLLFPVEYYVRTTRRMSAAQSSVDLGAVIQSQLSGGRAGRGRGRGRRGRGASAVSRTAVCKDTDAEGHVTPESESSLTLRSSPPALGAGPPKPARGRRRRGGRKSRPGQGQASPCSSTRGMKALLPSSPAPQRPHVATLGESHLSLRFLLSHFDTEDFHLPDDEFGTLKRQKLRSTARDLEAFVPHCSPYLTRQRALGTPLGNSYRKKPASRTSHQTDLGSDRDAPKSPPPSFICGEVTHKGEGPGCDSLPVERGNGAEPIAGGCARQGGGVGVGAGQEEGSVCTGADVEALSPHVLNLSLTPTLTVPQTPKNTTLALSSCGSPSFPSLGVTPAIPLHSRPPTQDCTYSTPPNALSPHNQATAQSTAPCTPPQGVRLSVLSCEPSPEAQTPSLSLAPCSGRNSQSQNALCAAQTEAEPHKGEEFTGGDQCVAHARSPDAMERPVTDSLSSLCQSPSALPVSSHSSPCPLDARSLLPEPLESRRVLPLPLPPEDEDGAVVSSAPLTDRKGEALQRTRALPVLGGRGCVDPDPDPDADMGSMPTPCMEEEVANPQTPAQVSLRISDYDGTQHSGCPAPRGPDTLPSCSLRSEHGDRDLDSYFTDTAWSRGVQTPSQPGHSAWGQSPAEKRLETPPPSPPGGREGPLCSSLKLTHTLKAPPGRCLVDVCSVYGAAGWCVVTAEEWEVCVWGQSSSQRWSLLHTWKFTEHPVISLLSVPDSHRLLCVSLGKLEIREARVLCCAGATEQLSQAVLCSGEVQAVLGVSGARVACCAASGSTQTVQVFTLSEEGRLEDSLSLVSPGQSVQALAAVDGQSDALIGSTDSSHLVLWNMRTGHLLQRFPLGESVSGTMCVRGYSQSGVLFVLLQHRFLLNNLDEGAPFSLIATNPVTAKSVLVHQLAVPSQCVGRFTDGDVWGSAVVAVFQSGFLAVWDLRDSDCVARLARGPEEGCHIARWGGPRNLLTGHLNGEVFLYQYTPLGLL